MDDNYATMWEAIADRLPDELAIVQGDRRESWREFDDRSARIAGALHELGVGPGATVASYLYNCPEYLEIAYAAFKLRAIPVNANFRYVDDELVYILDDAQAEVLVFHGSLGERVARVRERLPLLKAVVQVDDGSPLIEGAIAFEDLVADHPPMERIARSGDDLWVLYTGGTTGRPKGVVWRHEDLFATLGTTYRLSGAEPPETVPAVADRAAELHASGQSPIVMPGSPLIHGTAFMLSQTALLLGGTVVLLAGRSLDAHELWRTVAAERVNQIVIVGDAFAKPMVRALEEAESRGSPYDTSSVSQIVSSGVMWSEPVKQALADRGQMLLVDILGASEGGPFGTSMVGPGLSAATAVFTLGDRAVLLREDDTVIPPGSSEVGVLAVSPPTPSGYWRDPEKTAKTFREIRGVRYSVPGDYARVDADGTMHLLGRGSVCVNTGGEKVYPEEVEEAIKEHPAVEDCNIVGVPDDKWGEAVVAVVSLRPDSQVTEPELIEFLREKVARYKQPKQIVFVDEVKRGPTGKADYRWARERAAGGLGKPATT